MKKKAYLILFENFEELEAVAPLDILRRGGVETLAVSASDNLLVRGRNGIILSADTALAAIDTIPDALIIPGGPGVFEAAKDARIMELVRKCREGGSLVCAICAAPTLLAKAGITEGKKLTSHFSVRDKFGDNWTDAAVMSDGALITSQGAGTAVEFGLEILSALEGNKCAFDVAKAVCLNKFQPSC